jgi:hypothetical protein
MKVFKQVKLLYKKLVYQKTICDRCGQEINRDGSYDKFDCTLSLREGRSFPEGDFSTIKTMDLCQKCGNTLFNSLEKEGYKVHECDYDAYTERINV